MTKFQKQIIDFLLANVEKIDWYAKRHIWEDGNYVDLYIANLPTVTIHLRHSNHIYKIYISVLYKNTNVYICHDISIEDNYIYRHEEVLNLYNAVVRLSEENENNYLYNTLTNDIIGQKPSTDESVKEQDKNNIFE